jgi:TPR repeat protein
MISIVNAKNVKELEIKCNDGIFYACEQLGFKYMNMDGSTHNFIKSKKYFNKAIQYLEDNCSKNNYYLCYRLAEKYYKGRIVEKNTIKALEYYEKSCNGKESRACKKIAMIYNFDEDFLKYQDIAPKYLEKSCVLGKIKTCFFLGELYKTGKKKKFKVTKNLKSSKKFYNEAIRQIEKKCNFLAEKIEYNSNIGEVHPCVELSVFYDVGSIVQEDEVKSNSLLKKAYSQIGAKAYAEFADKYSREMKLSKKNIKDKCNIVLSYAKKACQSGYSETCYILGMLHYDGGYQYYGDCRKLVNKDIEKAIYYHEKGCALGNRDSCFRLGMIYYLGRGSLKNNTMAIRYFEQLCNKKDSSGCHYVGKIYEERFNYKKAKKYYEKSCDMGNDYGCKSYHKLKGQELNPKYYQQK